MNYTFKVRSNWGCWDSWHQKEYISGQIIIFHQPRFPWNKGISLSQLPFGVRSCEVAIIWPDILTFACQCVDGQNQRRYFGIINFKRSNQFYQAAGCRPKKHLASSVDFEKQHEGSQNLRHADIMRHKFYKYQVGGFNPFEKYESSPK